MSKPMIGLMYILECLVIVIGALLIPTPLGEYNKASTTLTYNETYCTPSGGPSSGSGFCDNFRGDVNAYNDDLQHYKDIMNANLRYILIVALITSLIGGIFGLIGWIGMQINLAKARLWAWFALNFLFGSLSWIIYLIIGPDPDQQVPVSRPAPAAQPAAPSSSPQALSALDILKQRYARGEVDTTTYHQMRDELLS